MRNIKMLYDLRIQKGWTQEQLANMIGVQKAAVSKYENGKLDIPNDTLVKLSDIFNVSTDAILGITTKLNPQQELESRLKLLNLNFEEASVIISSFKDYLENPNFNNSDITANNPRFQEAFDILNDFIDNYTSTQIDSIDFTLKHDNDKIKEQIINTTKKSIYSLVSNIKINNITEDASSKFYMCPVYGQISAGQPNWAEECIEGRIPLDPDLMGIVNPEEHFFLRVNGESMNKIIRNGAFALIHKQDTVENGEIAVVLVNGYDATLKKFTRQDELIILEPQSNDESFKTQVYDKTTPIKILGKYVGKMEINK